MVTKEQLDKDRLPSHIAIIMDGNGRWAQKRGNARVFGHKNGVEAVRDTVEGAAEIGINYLTLYAFSTENWKRPRTEIDALMALLVSTIHKETKTLMENNVRLRTIGDFLSLPKGVQSNLQKAMELTKNNSGLNLILALSYSSRWEIIDTIKRIGQEMEQGRLKSEDIDEEVVKKFLNTSDFPDPELLIRTSGEFRISNFLLYQIAYSELYFTDILWPDFRREHLFQAIVDYQCRERRFGKISEQVSKKINVNS